LEEFVETGRRKSAVASVRLRPEGSGKIDINGKAAEKYFPIDIQREIAFEPLKKVEGSSSYDLVIRVKGGGVEGQVIAVRHGLTRALVKQNEELRHDFKALGFLTRDSRKKERKKYGQPGARKKYQFSKR